MVLSRPVRVKAPKYEDVYHDYTTIVIGSALDSAPIDWRLENSATYSEFQIWESIMDQGFARCRELNSTFGGRLEHALAYRRVDETVASWWNDERSAQDITGGTSSWGDFKQFLRTRFMQQSTELDKVIIPEEVEPLSGLNMQLKRVHDEACKIVDKGQRWSLFQTQCMIKGKHCKLMIDGGSCTNGISKAVVASLV